MNTVIGVAQEVEVTIQGFTLKGNGSVKSAMIRLFHSSLASSGRASLESEEQECGEWMDGEGCVCVRERRLQARAKSCQRV